MISCCCCAKNKINMKPKFIIVFGTFAGGMNALIELVNQLKGDMFTAVFIVMHLSGTA